MHTCICVCMYVYVCIGVYMYVCVCMDVCMYTCICRCMYVCMYECVCVCICVYMYVCVYACMYIKAKCEKSTETSSKVATYLTMHPTLEVHPIYYLPHTILDEKRVEFSRFRLSAHRLKVVTGRWLRTPRERRTCSCDSSSRQDERHALLECPLTVNIRQKFNIIILHSFQETCSVLSMLDIQWEAVRCLPNLSARGSTCRSTVQE